MKLNSWTPACVIIKKHAVEPYTISLICGGVSLTKECAGEDFSCCSWLMSQAPNIFSLSNDKSVTKMAIVKYYMKIFLSSSGIE